MPLNTSFVTHVLPSAVSIPVESRVAAMFDSAADAIVAQHTSPSQTTATVLTARFNRVVTVTSAADAVKLPPALAGMTVKVKNAHATNAINVYPAAAGDGGAAGGDAINALGQNNAFSQAATLTTVYTCYTTGIWVTN